MKSSGPGNPPHIDLGNLYDLFNTVAAGNRPFAQWLHRQAWLDYRAAGHPLGPNERGLFYWIFNPIYPN